jgi:ABC-type phosphate transport system substrate-binding protein
MNFNKVPTTKCPECGYEANAPTALYCALCTHPLRDNVAPVKGRRAFVGKGALSSQSLPRGGSPSTKKSIPSKQSPSPLRWVALSLPPLLIAAGYCIGSSSWSSRPVSSVPAASSISQPSRIQLHSSMKEVQNVPTGLFNYAGAVTFASINAQTMRNAISQAYPAFRLRYTEPTSGKPGSTAGIQMLLNSEISFAQSARPLEDGEYSKAKARNLVLEQIPVALDGVAFYVHPGLPVSGLSIDQLRSIFLGRVTNWKQVGGPNLPIVPFSLDPKLVSMINLVLGSDKDKGLGSNVQLVRDVTSAVRKVASTPGAIGYASASEVARQKTIHPLKLARGGSTQYVNPVLGRNLVNVEAFQNSSYPLTRRLFVVIRRDGTLDEQAGVAYASLLLSNEGQKIIEQSGFVAIR